MNDVKTLREEILSAAQGEGLEGRLAAFEDAVRHQEREETLAAIRHSLNTLRSLVAFLRQEVRECSGPLEKLCRELESETAGVLPHPPAHPETRPGVQDPPA